MFELQEMLKEGRLAIHTQMLEKYRPSMLELLKIQGLGPKTIALIWSAYKVSDVEGVEKLAREGKIQELPRMGAKQEQKLLKAIEDYRRIAGRFLLDVAEREANKIIEHLRHFPGVEKITPAGSLRRGRETVGDLDILVTGKGCCDDVEREKLIEHIIKLPGLMEVIARGENKVSFRLRGGMQVDAPSPEALERMKSGTKLTVTVVEPTSATTKPPLPPPPNRRLNRSRTRRAIASKSGDGPPPPPPLSRQGSRCLLPPPGSFHAITCYLAARAQTPGPSLKCGRGWPFPMRSSGRAAPQWRIAVRRSDQGRSQELLTIPQVTPACRRIVGRGFGGGKQTRAQPLAVAAGQAEQRLDQGPRRIDADMPAVLVGAFAGDQALRVQARTQASGIGREQQLGAHAFGAQSATDRLQQAIHSGAAGRRHPGARQFAAIEVVDA